MRTTNSITSAIALPVMGLVSLSTHAEDNAEAVTFDVRNIPIDLALGTLAQQSGYTFVLSPDVVAATGPGISMEAGSVDQAIEVLAVAYRACFKSLGKADSVLVVLPCQTSAVIGRHSDAA